MLPMQLHVLREAPEILLQKYKKKKQELTNKVEIDQKKA
jgi:hypothetical protein